MELNKGKTKANPSDYLANERTFLAWIRTCIGIMAFGFVVVKFSLFLKQLSLMLGKETVVHSNGYSGIVGIVLVVIGTVAIIMSYIRYRHSEKQINEGNYKHSSLLITTLTAFIFLISVFLIVYLLKSI